jgi:hypothetical protein
MSRNGAVEASWKRSIRDSRGGEPFRHLEAVFYVGVATEPLVRTAYP